jgi:hypothetical protein
VSSCCNGAFGDGGGNSWPSLESKLKRQINVARQPSLAAQSHRAARYDARRALIVISLEGGCEFSFPTALAEGLTDAPRSKLKK